MRHPYREAEPERVDPSPRTRRRWADLDAEILIFAVCALAVAIGCGQRCFGSLETLALLGLFFSGRVIVGTLRDR